MEMRHYYKDCQTTKLHTVIKYDSYNVKINTDKVGFLGDSCLVYHHLEEDKRNYGEGSQVLNPGQ